MRVLVCGGRDFTDREYVYETLDAMHAKTPISCIIHGAARGADRLGRDWAVTRGVWETPFHADWKRLGLRAGPIRNRQMLVEGKPDFVVAFPGGNGTANMVTQSVLAGIPGVSKIKSIRSV